MRLSIRKLILVVTSIIAIYLCLFIFVLKKPFLLGNDQWFQYNIFYKEWIRLVINFFETGSLPMYSYNMYLGTDFYSAMGYYCTGDIFLPLLLLFQNNIELGLLVESILCIYISAILMYIFFCKYGVKNELNKIFVSLVYSLSGIVTLYYGNYMFHRFFSFLPLLFIGLINYFNNKKVGFFVIATAILFLQNYYFMFPTLIFLFIFSLMYEIKLKKQFKVIFKDFIILLTLLILGFMISAVIALPSIMYLMNNTRLGNSSIDSIFWPSNTYAGLYMSVISFYPAEIISNLFENPENYHTSYYSLFVTILPLIGLINYLKKKENRPELFTFIILIVIASLTPLSSVMHGFSIPSLRWIFLLEFFILLIGTKGLDDNIEDSKIKIIYIVYIIGYIILFILLCLNNIDISKYITHILIIIVSLTFSLVIINLFIKSKIKIAIILSIVEIVGFEGYFLYLETNGAYKPEEVINVEEMDYMQSIDNDVKRYYMNYKINNPASYLNQNKSLDYNFMSTTSYNSMTDYNVSLFNKLSNSADKNLDWILQVNDPYACTMLGTKYWIVYKEDELPSELNFKYAYNLDYLSVYENLDYKGFGYTSDKLKYTKDFNTTKDFSDYILIDDESIDISKYTNISYSKLNITSKYDNYLEANITLDEDNILLIPLPNNKGWTIKINGQTITPISVNGGFIGIELTKGYNEISMNFISPYFKEGLILTGIGLVSFIILMIGQGKKNSLIKT